MIDLGPHAPRDSSLPPDPGPSPDEWSVMELDLDAYLARVGLAGADLPPTAATLAAVHRAHLGAIRFENLDIMLGRAVRVDLPSIAAKLVAGRRGGYCYEQGQLFGAALERLGFGVDRRLARVWRPGPVPPRTHLTLRVTVPDGGQAWLADVGFGSSPPGPVSLDEPGPQEIDGWTYDVVPGDRPGTWDLRELEDGEWVRQYQFDGAIVVPVDVVLSNHYTSTYPGSWFTHTPIVVRRDPDAITSLLGRTRTVTRPGHVKERRELPDGEWLAALEDVFGLPFTPPEQARLLATAGGV
ncbi:MAG TPA: arylamine N-acetyltransferase [Trebonia sp.]|jgi:N-hydroxyarylamine O-acetyltransferase|nr:arylamine N-acetyltransferase [Trebonia sp.]